MFLNFAKSFRLTSKCTKLTWINYSKRIIYKGGGGNTVKLKKVGFAGTNCLDPVIWEFVILRECFFRKGRVYVIPELCIMESCQCHSHKIIRGRTISKSSLCNLANFLPIFPNQTNSFPSLHLYCLVGTVLRM